MSEGTPGSPFQLVLGDCLPFLRSLPDKSVDHVITDPPYSERVHKGQKRGVTNAVESLSFAHFSEEARAEFAREVARISRRWVVAFTAAEDAHALAGNLEANGLRWFRFGIWVKPNAMPRFSGDGPSMGFEAMVIAHPRGKTRWNAGGRVGVWTFPTAPTGLHETAKPLPLMEALVRDFTDEGETILDPFAGSGTTGVAALKLGRRFIGCELSPKYHAVALKRLSNAREQLGLWTGAA